MQSQEIGAQEHGLHQSLTRAQITMIGLGGAIGTGLFLGSSLAIGYAGPAVLLSYIIAGFAAVVMVFSLSEMAVAHPAAGSFGVYAETYLNPWAGFFVRYTYWMSQVIAVGGEAVAAGVYMTFWFPDIPVWIWSIGFAVVLLYVNSRSVGNFGSVEYWFALIKVIAIVIFVILGGATILGIGQPAVGFHNLTGLPGGFMPNGFHGVWLGVLIGIFSFTGIELIAVTSGETADPKTAIPAALRTMAIRLILFYILALGIVVCFVPWTQTAALVSDSGARLVEESPFVRIFAHTGIAHAAGIMNFVVISAALSSMNTNVYLASRMLFSLSRGRYAPAFLGRLNARGAPVAAILTSGGCIVAAALLSKLRPDAYQQLFGVALFGAISVWITILICHLRFRAVNDVKELPVRMPLFPYMQIAGIALLSAILITMAFDKDWRIAWICGVPWTILLTVAYFLWKRSPARRIA